MTDRAIVRAGLDALERAYSESDIDALLADYLDFLAVELEGSADCRVHTGIEAALDAATAAGCAIGLGTGNIRAGARLKLTRAGIYGRFAFGGFGCDHERRDELLRIGAERGAAALGVPRAACRVVVIGDTPKDVAAAQAIGAESIAVATGTYDESALAASGATWVFADLSAGGAMLALLG